MNNLCTYLKLVMLLNIITVEENSIQGGVIRLEERKYCLINIFGQIQCPTKLKIKFDAPSLPS